MPTEQERDQMMDKEKNLKEIERIEAALKFAAEQARAQEHTHPVGTDQPQAQTEGLKSACNRLRHYIEQMGKDVLGLRHHPQMEEDKGDRSEMIANVMLSYRHLEDARMRLGKVIQAYEGGVSIYSKENEDPNTRG